MKNKIQCLLLLITLPAVGAKAENDFDISANLMLDAVDYQGTVFVNENGERSDGQDLYVRRAKVEMKVEATSWLEIEASGKYDLDEDLEIADLFLAFKPIKDWSLVVGQFKEPAGMEKMQGLGSQFFNERSLATNVYSSPRKPGVKIEYDGKWAWAEAAYMLEDSRSPYFDDGRVLAVRVAVNPYRDKSNAAFVHMGGFYSTRDEVELRYDTDEPLIIPSFGNLFHSPNYYAEKIDTSGIEIAAGFQKVLFQAEIFSQNLYERDGDEWRQDGYYTTFSWTVLGKPRKYKNAKIQYNKKNNSALEISARMSEADTVNFGEGDRAKVLSLAANYYFSKYFKLTLEYESAELESYNASLMEESSGDSIAVRLSAGF